MHTRARLVELFARLPHILRIRTVGHFIPELIGVTQQLSLLVAQSLELSLDLTALLGLLRRLQRRLQFAKSLVEIFLSPSELTKAI